MQAIKETTIMSGESGGGGEGVEGAVLVRRFSEYK